MCDVESWSFAYHTKWNISKTKQENKYLSKEVTLQFSMIFQIRLKNNTQHLKRNFSIHPSSYGYVILAVKLRFCVCEIN
jgi:hypothetical protein